MATPATAPQMSPGAENQLLLQATAWQFLVQTLNNPDQRSLFFPTLTDAGNKLLRKAGLDPAQCGPLLEILHLAAAAQVNTEPVPGTQNDAQQKWLNLQNQAGLEAFKQTNQVLSELMKGLKRNVLDTATAYERTMWMYVVSFYAGLAMIVVAIVFAWVGKDRLFPLAFGGLGTASTITFFFTKPPEGLQSSRVGLAQLQSALLSWFADFVNQQAMFQQRTTQPPPITLREYEQAASTLVDRTGKWMKMIHQAAQDVVPAAAPEEPGKKESA
jgi:hypothetical protein